MRDDELLFAKVKPKAIIPTKDSENAGYDIYPCFDEDYLIIPSLETVLVPTGIASAMSERYYAQIEERGSTGKISMKKSAGVIDSSYRGEWFIAITNCGEYDIIISKVSYEDFRGRLDVKPFLIEDTYDLDGFILNEPTTGNVRVISRSNFYPYTKAIAQAIIHEVPQLEVKEISYEELSQIPSKRGTGKLGSSGK